MTKNYKNRREGRCYELAWQHVAHMQEGVLIHANVYSPHLKQMIGHAEKCGCKADG